MTYLIDTDVAVHLRDGTASVIASLAGLRARPAISLMTWVELEGGAYKIPELAASRRLTIDRVVRRMMVLPMNDAVVRRYSMILAARGFSRRRVIDRLIAATAIVNDLTLITMNGDDFRDIPGLRLEIWPAPAQ